MPNDDILCEAPGPGNMTCDKPYGHEEQGDTSHHFTIELPPQVGQMIDSIMTDMEETRAQMEREKRFYQIGKYLFWGGFALYITLTVARFFVS